MSLDHHWFSEIHAGAGSAFSLHIKKKLHEEQSEFQKIEVYDTEGYGHLMVIDGCTMLSSRDNFIYHEMMAHPVLYSHPKPERVAIIGGGDCGTLREVLRHDAVKHVTQIDIDERVTRVSESFFAELCESNNDPRADLKFIDGIKWMQEQPTGSLDVIIVDSTDPVGPGEVLFTDAFFQSCFNALDKDGLIVQQSESPLLHTDSIINTMHQRMHKAGFSSTQTLLFPLPIYPSGWWSATMAGKQKEIRFVREQDSVTKPLKTDYYNTAIHHAALALPNFMKR